MQSATITQTADPLRSHLLDAMQGHLAHPDFEAAVKAFPTAWQGLKPHGAPHTAWQLLEHIRIALHDILEFSRSRHYQSPKWPEGYWPKTCRPPSTDAWDSSVAAIRHDLAQMHALIHDPESDLFNAIPWGDGQTLLREALLVASHNSYHLGQLMFLRKMIEASISE
jgi:DinB superfamily